MLDFRLHQLYRSLLRHCSFTEQLRGGSMGVVRCN